MLISFTRYCLCRKPILLNSAIHPFSILMILFSRSLKLIVMPHGEFLDPALVIKKNKKVILLTILKYLMRCVGSSKNLKLVTTTEAEGRNFAKYFSVRDTQIMQDVVHFSELTVSFQKKFHERNGPLHIVMIGRMVRIKGFKKVLDELIGADLDQIHKVSLYYVEEEPAYLFEVQKAAEKLRHKGIEVSLLAGRDAEQIYTECSATNAMLIMPSDFESFGHVLIENLWMPNKPIVSFKNRLTTYLSELGQCKVIEDNQFSEAIKSAEPTDSFAAHNAIEPFINAMNKNTLEILFQTEP
jgi:glycosyltransferase involved in cell wall biosynthesis